MKTRHYDVWLSSLTLAFAGFGDTILYLILPIYGEEMGFSLFWIGAFLAVNRFVRILAHSLISYFMAHFGYKTSMVIASIVAVGTTVSYGFLSNVYVFLFARILWGLSFSLLRLSSMAYATQNSTKHSIMLGINIGIKTLGGVVAILIGQLLVIYVNIQVLFSMVGAISIISIVLSMKLSQIPKDKIDIPVWKTLKLYPIHQIAFITSFVVDGVLVVGLSRIILIENIETLSMIVGIYLILKKVLYSFMAFISGKLVMKFGLYKMFVISMIMIALAIIIIASGFYEGGIILAFLSNGLLTVLLTTLAIEEGNLNRLQAIGAVTTWWDLGAASGSILGLILIQAIMEKGLFWILSIFVIYATILAWKLSIQKRKRI